VRKGSLLVALICAISPLVAGCEFKNIQNNGPTSPSGSGSGAAITSVRVSPTNPTITLVSGPNGCTASQQFSATILPANAYQAVYWESSGGSISSTGLFTATSAGTFTITAKSTQDYSKTGSTTVTVNAGNCGGTPTGTFTNTTPIACAAANGEYSVFLGWTGLAGADSYRVEIRSSHDMLWRNARELGTNVVINNNALTMERLRTDRTHTFRVIGLRGNTETLWAAREEDVTCRRLPACSNFGDDDGDRRIDRDDPGCSYPGPGYNPNDEDETDPPLTGGTPPPVGTPPGTTTPPAGNVCSGMSFTVGATSGARGTSTPYSLFAPAGCQVVFESDNTHVGAPSSGRVYFYNPGTFNVCLRSVAGHGQICQGMRTN
jgi:hypothetical protein